MRKIFILILCLIFVQNLYAVSIDTNIDRDSTNLKDLKIADRIYLDIKITHSKDDSVYLDKNFANELQKDSDFVLISHQKELTSSEQENISKFDLTSAFFDVGAQTIPALKFNIINKDDTTVVYSDSIEVQINSVIEDDSATQQIKDIAKPISISLTAWDIIFPIVVLIIIAVIIFILIKRKSGKTLIPVKKKKKIPAHVIALRKLDELALDKLLEQGKIKQFFVRISWICREYLKNRYKLPVLESTSTEIKRLLKKNNVKLQAKFYNFLIECDQVKYARFPKSINEGQKMMEDLESLIMKTRKIMQQEQKVEEEDNEHNIS